ncbi:MAG TPA: dihydrolipoyl dehydrogenase [Firmicutes bacterium]|nr:dihydrolipoyl dehydrogenase [Bacillota bacterium]
MLAEFDVAVVGGGPGGYVAAIRAAQLGRSVCLIEKDQLGGTCLNRGCIPTKALVASVQALETAKRLAEFGVEFGGQGGDCGGGEARARFDRMVARKDRVVARLRAGIGFLLKKNKVAVIAGTGRMMGPGRIEVDAKEGPAEVRARDIIIATGSKPVIFPSFGYDGRVVITSDEALDFQDVPESLLIVGGGVIGCEFAFIFSSLGSRVTVVDIMPTILPMEDPDSAAAVADSLKKRKVVVRTGVKIERIAVEGDEAVAVLDNGERLSAARVLLSVGRRANSEGIGLEDAGVEIGKRGEVVVNDQMATNVPGIYAIGDVVGKVMLAHVASAQGIVAAQNIAGADRRMSYAAVPSAIFTSPEVASVGLNERQAKEEGFDVRVGKFPFTASGKALAMGEAEGFVKIIADGSTDRILGIHIVGPHATELIPEPTMAVRMKMTVAEFARTIHAHPTLAEAIGEAAEAVHRMAIHV